MDAERAKALRSLPSVDAILSHPLVQPIGSSLLPHVGVSVARDAQDHTRAAILDGDVSAVDRLIEGVVKSLSDLAAPAHQPVINGTGVILQTNLGRAPLSLDAAEAMRAAAAGYVGLETDLTTGTRGGRGRVVEAMFRALTGAESALIVNNNAAAVLLALTALAAGREVIVSRGEAVEIGGGVRVPDILRQSGATLVEVGTTNRTYAADYASAISERTAALLRVHASNFAMIGFTARPDLGELADLARRRGIALIEDVGSGCLVETATYGLAHEPTLAESITAGADIVCASGDKLLGGPQAGIILGGQRSVEVLRRHPLARSVRSDKTGLAGLAATLGHYLRGDYEDRVPVWWMISRAPEWLARRVDHWIASIGDERCTAIDTESVVGGGSLPGRTLPSKGLQIAAMGGRVTDLATRLRTGNPAVFPRIDEDRVVIDARSVLQDEDAQLVEAVRAALAP